MSWCYRSAIILTILASCQWVSRTKRRNTPNILLSVREYTKKMHDYKLVKSSGIAIWLKWLSIYNVAPQAHYHRALLQANALFEYRFHCRRAASIISWHHEIAHDDEMMASAYHFAKCDTAAISFRKMMTSFHILIWHVIDTEVASIRASCGHRPFTAHWWSAAAASTRPKIGIVFLAITAARWRPYAWCSLCDGWWANAAWLASSSSLSPHFRNSSSRPANAIAEWILIHRGHGSPQKCAALVWLPSATHFQWRISAASAARIDADGIASDIGAVSDAALYGDFCFNNVYLEKAE